MVCQADPLDFPGPYIIYVNPAFERLTGWKLHEVLGKNPRMFQGPKTDRAALRRLREAMDAGRSCVVELVNYRRDRSEFELELSVFPLHDSCGKLTHFLSVQRDITLEKRALASIAASEERYRSLVQTIPHGIKECDVHGRVTFANDALLRMLGMERSELLAAGAAELVVDPAHRLVFPADLRDRSAPNPASVQAEMRAKDGRLIDVQIDRTYKRDAEGVITGCVSVITDISARKKAEAALVEYQQRLESLVAQRTAELERSFERVRLTDRLASIGTLAAGLGHDISNLLFPMRCRVDRLTAMKLPDDCAEDLAGLRTALDLMWNLTQGLRLFALDPEDRAALNDRTDLAVWAHEVGPLLMKSVKGGTRLSIELPEGLPPARIAPHQLSQAVLNLVVNAGEAVGPKGRVRLWAETHGRDRIRVAVTDDGVGMTPEVRRQAMDPFFTTKPRSLSTGLGLSIVHRIASLAGGEVEIESAPGAGTTVSLLVRRADAAGPAATAASGGRRPLACIDLADRRIAAYTTELLRSAGFRTVASAREPTAEAVLLVIRAGPGDDVSANAFLDGRTDRRVLAVGRPDGAWNAPEAKIVDDSGGLEGLRTAVQEAARSLGVTPP
ncbi:MAG: PAS domain S-box protein [Phycisphaerales bacterium]|nr:PAS domain S-box protein [Phycisphaerales bacterium]